MVDKKRATFVPLSVHYSRDAAIAAAGEAAELLFLRGLAYCKSTDDTGHIPTYELPVVAARLTKVQARVDALVREELWVEVDGGWQVRSWDAWNNDEQARRKREQANARQQARRDREREKRDGHAHVTRDTRDDHAPKGREGKGRESLTTSEVTPSVTSLAVVPDPKPARAIRLPTQWVPPYEWLAWARQQGLPAEVVDREVDKFRDYWTTKSGRDATKLDWGGVWRNWIRRAAESQPTRPSATHAAVSQGAALVARYSEEP